MQRFLCDVVETKATKPSFQDISAFQQFPRVFLEEILGMSPIGEVQFCIDLVLWATPFSKSPYRMAPIELKELNIQLDELLEKGYIEPSMSPWPTPVLFVKRTMEP